MHSSAPEEYKKEFEGIKNILQILKPSPDGLAGAEASDTFYLSDRNGCHWARHTDNRLYYRLYTQPKGQWTDAQSGKVLNVPVPIN